MLPQLEMGKLYSRYHLHELGIEVEKTISNKPIGIYENGEDGGDISKFLFKKVDGMFVYVFPIIPKSS